MLFFELTCGSTVYLDDFHYSRTYGGLLEGSPNAEMNARIVKRAMERMEPIWGKRKTHLIPPEIDHSDPQHPSLPSTELTAWLTCNEPNDSHFDGSELVLIWYVDDGEFELSSIHEVTSRALKQINWSELAEDFHW